MRKHRYYLEKGKDAGDKRKTNRGNGISNKDKGERCTGALVVPLGFEEAGECIHVFFV